MNTERKICPFCGESIAASAKKCRFCGEWLTEDVPQSFIPQINTTSQPVVKENREETRIAEEPQVREAPVEETPMEESRPEEAHEEVHEEDHEEVTVSSPAVEEENSHYNEESENSSATHEEPAQPAVDEGNPTYYGGETYTASEKLLRTWLSLTCVFFICGILMAIFRPEARFYLFFDESEGDSIRYFLGLFLVSLICFLIYLVSLGKKRTTRYLFTTKGELDIETPRYYIKLERPKLLELNSRKGLAEFSYDGNGYVYLKKMNGKEFSGYLSDMNVKYWMEKNKVDGSWFLRKMKITDNLGNKFTFINSNSLMDEEYDDIHMILSTAAEVKEAKSSKAGKWANKILESVSDFDFSDMATSLGGAAIDVGSSVFSSVKNSKKGVNNKVVEFVKSKAFVSQKKNPWWKKLWENFLIVIGLLYIALILIFNIALLPEIFSGKQHSEFESNLYDPETGESMAPAAWELIDQTFYGSGEIDIPMTGFDEAIEMELTFNNDGTVIGKYCTSENVSHYGEKAYTQLRGFYDDQSILLENVENSYSDEVAKFALFYDASDDRLSLTGKCMIGSDVSEDDAMDLSLELRKQ